MQALEPKYRATFPYSFYSGDEDAENEDASLALDYDVTEEGDVSVNFTTSAGILTVDLQELNEAIAKLAVSDGEGARLK